MKRGLCSAVVAATVADSVVPSRITSWKHINCQHHVLMCRWVCTPSGGLLHRMTPRAYADAGPLAPSSSWSLHGDSGTAVRASRACTTLLFYEVPARFGATSHYWNYLGSPRATLAAVTDTHHGVGTMRRAFKSSPSWCTQHT